MQWLMLGEDRAVATILTAFHAPRPSAPDVSVQFARSNYRENPEAVLCAVGRCAAGRRMIVDRVTTSSV